MKITRKIFEVCCYEGDYDSIIYELSEELKNGYTVTNIDPIPCCIGACQYTKLDLEPNLRITLRKVEK